MAPSTPTPIGRYAVHGELASGGMAAVYYARLLGPSGFARTVAVKRPHAQLAKEREFAMMFIDEARVASRIRHPNVVSTLDVIATPTELALVMDYVHGESVSKLAAAARARGERVPLAIAAAILIDALHGLHAAHEATDEAGKPLGIVHRDFSPQNLLVGADGITRIADFGIAKATGRLLTTRDGAIKGKYAYMAPEQIRGERVTRQTDIYAASIVLWELLTGQGLFRGENEAEEIYKCLEAAVPLPSSICPDLPAGFDAIALRGLARSPDERYPTARAMAADIERAAPAVRPSEIGAWVERLAGDVLKARAAVIAEMEGSGQHGEQATVPASLAVTNVARSGSAPPPSQDVASQVSAVGLVAERSHRSTGGGTGRWGRLIASVSLGALLIVGTYVAFAFGRRSYPGRAVAGDARPPIQVTAPAAPPSATVAAPAPPPLAAARPPATASASPPVVPGAASATKPTRGPRSGRPSSAACDPPYIVDSSGREIFKMQCL